LLLVSSFFVYLTSKGWVCDNFPPNFHFFLDAIHEKYNFKYFKNPTVKVCKIWFNDVYRYFLYYDIFWWKLINRIVLIRFLIPGWYLRASPLFSNFHCLHVIISKQDIHIYYLLHINWTITLSSVLKPKYSLSTRNKCVYLLKAFETSFTIWHQEYPQNSYI